MLSCLRVPQVAELEQQLVASWAEAAAGGVPMQHMTGVWRSTGGLHEWGRLVLCVCVGGAGAGGFGWYWGSGMG
jgi:hypothetical protein